MPDKFLAAGFISWLCGLLELSLCLLNCHRDDFLNHFSLLGESFTNLDETFMTETVIIDLVCSSRCQQFYTRLSYIILVAGVFFVSISRVTTGLNYKQG